MCHSFSNICDKTSGFGRLSLLGLSSFINQKLDICQSIALLLSPCGQVVALHNVSYKGHAQLNNVAFMGHYDMDLHIVMELSYILYAL